VHPVEKALAGCRTNAISVQCDYPHTQFLSSLFKAIPARLFQNLLKSLLQAPDWSLLINDAGQHNRWLRCCHENQRFAPKEPQFCFQGAANWRCETV